MRVGWIGLGIMGSRMAANLRRAGHELVVCNRTRATAEAWAAEHGGEVVDTPADIRAEVVITMLVDAAQVEEALLGLKAGPMRAHDYTTLFKLEHMLKDVRLCLESGQAAGVGFPAAAEVREILSSAMGRGLGDHDFAALLEVLEGAAGLRVGERE